MTLRPEYSLGHSAYNGFLHAEVGEEANGIMLTVLTALTRLGIDPWQEAARLADLPRDVAVTALAAALARLPAMSPGGNWKAADAEAIATRLAGLLPGHSSAPLQQPAARPAAARSAVVTRTVAAPSTMPEAVPAVTRPSFSKTAGSLARPSAVASGRGCSSLSIVLSPRRLLITTGAISSS